MSELFREIEEDIRRERLDKLWQKFGKLAVYASIGVVLATACFVAWENYSQGKAEKQTGKLRQAIELSGKKDYKEAIAIFSAIADDESSPYYGIAMLQKAQAQEASGDSEGAEKTYKELGGHEGVFAELASLRADGQKTENKVFAGSYAEKKAWDLLANGKKEEAAAGFASLLETGKFPRSLSTRASEVLRVIAPEKLAEKRVSYE